MSPTDVPVRLTHLWRRRGDGIVVFSDAHFNLVRLEFNDTGGRTWELMDGQRTLNEIVDRVAIEYLGVPHDLIALEVKRFVELLHVEWLVATREEVAAYA